MPSESQNQGSGIPVFFRSKRVCPVSTKLLPSPPLQRWGNGRPVWTDPWPPLESLRLGYEGQRPQSPVPTKTTSLPSSLTGLCVNLNCRFVTDRTLQDDHSPQDTPRTIGIGTFFILPDVSLSKSFGKDQIRGELRSVVSNCKIFGVLQDVVSARNWNLGSTCR